MSCPNRQTISKSKGKNLKSGRIQDQKYSYSCCTVGAGYFEEEEKNDKRKRMIVTMATHFEAERYYLQEWIQQQLIFWANGCPLEFLTLQSDQSDHPRTREKRSKTKVMLAQLGIKASSHYSVRKIVKKEGVWRQKTVFDRLETTDVERGMNSYRPLKLKSHRHRINYFWYS